MSNIATFKCARCGGIGWGRYHNARDPKDPNGPWIQVPDVSICHNCIQNDKHAKAVKAKAKAYKVLKEYNNKSLVMLAAEVTVLRTMVIAQDYERAAEYWAMVEAALKKGLEE